MEIIKLNETPRRTARNFNINNIKLEDIKIPKKIEEFKNIKIEKSTSKIIIDKKTDDFNISYGIGEEFINQINENSNAKLKVIVDSQKNSDNFITFSFSKENINLLEKIEIVANENSKSTIILKYVSEDETSNFHNGIVKLFAKKNSSINLIVVNLLNSKSNSFISLDNKLEDGANLNYTIVDFGGKNTISNLYSNLIGRESNCLINSIYLGKEEQLIDMNYIGELRGEKSNINIEVQGALKDSAKKHFKGTIDFKNGCKKAKGNENEFCTILSDKAKAIALPMLLCSEDDVEGNHSTAAGKVGEKELFYIMSRGFSQKEAMKLMVRAKFNGIIENISNEELREEILKEIDRRLD